MSISKEQYEQASKKFEEDIKNVDDDDVKYASKKGSKKIDDLKNNPPSSLKEIWEDVKLLIGLVKDFSTGEYKEVPWDTIAAATGAIVYFVSPVDVIPDVIPVLGYVDDAFVLKLALDFCKDDLEKYKNWKENN